MTRTILRVSGFVLSALLLFTSVAFACQFAYTPATTYTDGSAIPTNGLAGYTLYFLAMGATTPPALEATFPGAVASGTVAGACKVGTYTVRAVTTQGVESANSLPVVVKKPNEPTNLTGTQ